MVGQIGKHNKHISVTKREDKGKQWVETDSNKELLSYLIVLHFYTFQPLVS